MEKLGKPQANIGCKLGKQKKLSNGRVGEDVAYGEPIALGGKKMKEKLGQRKKNMGP